ncbi:hypothetical protein QFZ45_005650 [Pseudomonas synxantha]|nr:hypothetical protein [Pseudomonas synxantha]
MQQQRLGKTVELATGHISGIGEETLQATQALFLVFETFLDTSEAFVDQQLETLLHLLLIQVGRRPRDNHRQRATDRQYDQRHQPGRSLLTDKTKDFRATGLHRHGQHSQRQRAGASLWLGFQL